MKALKKLKRFTDKLLAKENINHNSLITIEVIDYHLKEVGTSLEELGGLDELRKIVKLHPTLGAQIAF